jgi:CDP-diglyceride synthetase
MTALDVLIMILFSWSVLRLTKKSARYLQTLTALAGTGAVLGLVGLPLIQQAARAHTGEEPAATLVVGWLMLLVWSISVQAHIYRHALSTRYGVGLLVAGLQMVLVISLLETLFPQVAGS